MELWLPVDWATGFHFNSLHTSSPHTITDPDLLTLQAEREKGAKREVKKSETFSIRQINQSAQINRCFADYPIDNPFHPSTFNENPFLLPKKRGENKYETPLKVSKN